VSNKPLISAALTSAFGENIAASGDLGALQEAIITYVIRCSVTYKLEETTPLPLFQASSFKARNV
jgi:hypothetical protein